MTDAIFPLRAEWERVQALPVCESTGRPLLAVDGVGYLPPLVCYPLKIDWLRAQPAQDQAAYPAPERTSRDSEVADMPSAVAKLAQFAREASWEVRVQASMGNVPHGSTGRPTALKQLIGLRFGAHPMTERRAYVVYESPASRSAWKPRSIMIWGPDLTPYAHCGMTELRAYLAEKCLSEASELRTWVRGLERERRAAEAFQKRRATVRVQIRKVADEGRLRASQQEDRAEWFKIDAEWRAKVADLQDGVFTSEEVAEMIDPARRRRTSREGLS